MKDMKYYLKVTLALLLICTVVSGLIAVVNSLTVDVIAANAQKAREQAVKQIFSSMTAMQDAEKEYPDGVNTVYAVYRNDACIGYAVDLDSRGFGGDINMIVGLGTDGTVCGVRVVSHAETPGLGSRATLADYLDNFIGVGERLTVKEDVDAISGATISSKAVVAGINLALSLGLGGVAAHG